MKLFKEENGRIHTIIIQNKKRYINICVQSSMPDSALITETPRPEQYFYHNLRLLCIIYLILMI